MIGKAFELVFVRAYRRLVRGGLADRASCGHPIQLEGGLFELDGDDFPAAM
ncbi:hypothetical protein U0035_09455 [Niabella yanshanensis]|uniref:Uncharacterized protein n=1 Tax=Niabella yanshanensis TaxID=577386 RepID=A0ABZ0WAP1_9BACT|nr:hypothetical protein [Niabella yanshanensis]WQD40370.1 hypothetical protein U0035_09455 [Niabella yanshanensis]